MDSILKKWPLSCIAGIMSFCFTYLFMFIAYLFFPTHFNFFTMTASTLGNINRNPGGAIFFKLSNIIGGILLIPFFLGLYRWSNTEKVQKSVLVSNIIVGCLMCFALTMVGVFSQEYRPYHFIWAQIYFFFSLITWIIMGIFLYSYTRSTRNISYIIFLIVGIHFTLVFYITHEAVIFEWVVIWATGAGYLLLVYNFKKMSDK